MQPTRRQWIGFAAATASPWPSGAAAAPAFPQRQPERALFPCPAPGSLVGVNPPGFAWWSPVGAASQRLLVRDRAGKVVYQAEGLKDPVHLPDRTLAPGEYTWDVEALDARGEVAARRGVWAFTVPAGIPELPWEDPKRILARVPESHPRYIFLAEDLPAVRATLQTTRRADWLQVKAQADRALKIPLPEPPRYHTFEGENRARMGYVHYFREFRRRVDATLTALSVAYLLSGEERYGLRAKQILLTVEPWGVEGPMSLLSKFGDEPGLSMARHGHRAYDFIYPLLDASERARLAAFTVARGRQILERLRRANYLAYPSESHNGRLIAYLAEHAIVLKTETPDAPAWLDYSLRGLTTFYPHWGDSDGGWAEGVSYALAYNMIYLAALESLRRVGFDLYRRPFFRNVRRFFLYCTSPIGEMKPFGDGADKGRMGGAALMTHHARRFQDPVSLWWARQVAPEGEADPLISLVTEDNVRPQPPSTDPSAAVFRGIGWAALHSALDNPKQDTFFLFKSSPFGSVSHSHADQNSFAILKGGIALAIPSGYYGPGYGMPHHAEWTRQTKANNAILVNGRGQIVRSQEAKGRIKAFQHQRMLTYVCGDAAAAYGGQLERFDRHVLFLRPGLFAVLDDLAAPAPATFQWLLHALDKMEVDEPGNRVICRRRSASLAVKLACTQPFSFTQTDVFDTPYNQGNPPEYHEEKENQWHLRASTTTPVREQRIGAALVVTATGEDLRTRWLEHPGWLGASLETTAGRGLVWMCIRRGATPPSGVRGDYVYGRWNPLSGEVEELAI